MWINMIVQTAAMVFNAWCRKIMYAWLYHIYISNESIAWWMTEFFDFRSQTSYNLCGFECDPMPTSSIYVSRHMLMVVGFVAQFEMTIPAVHLLLLVELRRIILLNMQIHDNLKWNFSNLDLHFSITLIRVFEYLIALSLCIGTM